MILVEDSDTGLPRSVTIRMKFLFEYINSGIQFYYKQNNKKHQYFWKDLKYFFIFYYIIKSIIKLLLMYIKNWIKIIKEAIKLLL